jgi:hypothetical protein
MRVRFFGKEGCEMCLAAMKKLFAAHMPIMYIDAESPNASLLCDQFGVDHLPHIQFLDNNNSVVKEVIGEVKDSHIKWAKSVQQQKNG